MKKSWIIAILLGLATAGGGANAAVITPVSAVLNAQARSTGGEVVAIPLIVAAGYGEFSNSASSSSLPWECGDSAHASIRANIQPDELNLSGTARAWGFRCGPHAGASALVKFEISTSSDWLLHVAGFDWNPWGPGPRLELSDSSGTAYLFDGRQCADCDVRLALAPGLYSLEAVVATDGWFGPGAGADLQASLRPVPNTVPIPATSGTFGPDLIMFGLFGVFIFLRPAWRMQRAREQSAGWGG